jgi:hypothetical protein
MERVYDIKKPPIRSLLDGFNLISKILLLDDSFRNGSRFG